MGPDLKKRLAPWALATGYGVAVAALLINALLAFWSLGVVQSNWDTLVGGRDYVRAIDGILRDLRDAERVTTQLSPHVRRPLSQGL